MGGGQAGEPADDDYVPWSGAGAGRGPDPARKADREGQGRSSRRLRRG
jgi:hypothetical protein